MILGMTLSTFTLVHVLISLAGIGSGFIVVYGLLTGRRLDSWTAIFLATTVLTSATGFLFPVDHLLPSHVVGIISLVALAIAILARYAFHLGRRLAMDLCRVRAVGPLLELLRSGDSVFPEDCGPARASSDTERAAIPDRATGSPGRLHRAWHSCGEELPRRSNRDGIGSFVALHPKIGNV
jgi:hypothetical protein